jgi:hypothetical protein
MKHMKVRPGRVRSAVGALALLLVPFAGCSDAKDTLLEATDPDLINPADVRSAEGALAMYNGALGRLRQATGGSSGEGSSWLFGGLLADEWSTSSTFVQNDETDQRAIKLDNGTVNTMFRDLARTRTSSNQAIALMQEFRPTESARIAELYFARGFAEMQMASDFCNGIPLSDGAGADIVFGKPLTNAQVFDAAVASFDSALALATGTAAASVTINQAARLGKARALLGLNKIAEAAALVPSTGATAIATSFAYNVTYVAGSGDNTLWAQPNSSSRYTVGDSVEGNGRNLLVKNAIPFFSAKDPRLPVSYTVSANGKDTTKAQDGLTFIRKTTRWARSTTVPVVNGLDARLIEAEGRLKANDLAGMIAILNALRAAPPKLGETQPAAMPNLTAPATQAAAIDLYFREKAFWTFSRGQRLGDLRRLVRQYGRTVDNVFPVGTHYKGGVYGADTNLPVPISEQNNPEIGAGNNVCIDRNP